MNHNTYQQSNEVVQPLLTDLYQITMAYAYWKAGRTDDMCTFDLFFRKNPFKGEFTIFAGLEECLKFVMNFKFSPSDIEYLKSVMTDIDNGFWDYLANVDCSKVKVYAIDEGTVVFPKVPLIKIEGPLPVVQLLETTFLNLVNFPSLVATNAARFRIAVGPDIQLLEFGLRRAQGPDGGLSASKYCYIGGFDGTSNVLAGKKYGIPIKGTHAHSFVNSFRSLDEVTKQNIKPVNGTSPRGTLSELTEKYLQELSLLLNINASETNKGERASFLAYAIAFPKIFLALVDTYSVLKSGLINFLSVALSLDKFGYRAIGIRLDSGDLAYLSKCCREIFNKVAKNYKLDWVSKLTIVASNDINEDTLYSLKEQHHQIDSFGIGTHLVTCQKQPALGCVFKLVSINGNPRMKLSEDVAKVNLPGRKDVYRLYNQSGVAMVDLVQLDTEQPPQIGKKIMVRHPLTESKRAYVTPQKVEKLHKLVWNGKLQADKFPTLQQLRNHTKECLKSVREDVKRGLNPTPYKVSVSDKMYNYLHEIWLQNAPVGEIL